ncbi:MAG: aminotransferase class V-fold PLP-dependent enzyme [Clostridia bacterium]|nr:aminotransferase class V-fold PLP-dependent enzyme [Clostridia bacterium]
MIYLDNAATSGVKPKEVKNRVIYSLDNLCANPGRGGHKASLAAAEAVYEVRDKLSSFFGAGGAEKVAFTANCTHALNFVIKGVLKAGDHAVVSDLEHNAVMRPLKAVTDNVSVAEVSFFDDDKTAESFKSLIKDDTGLVICTAASNVTGKILPLKKIGRICKEKGVPFLVDAAQGGGVIPIDMKEMNIDYLCLAPHKGFYAPMSTGVLIAEKSIGKTLIEGGNGTDSLSLIQSAVMPGGFESGTVGLPTICGIGGGVDFVNRRGRKNIYDHETSLISRLYDRLSSLEKVIFYTPRPENGSFAPVLSFNVSGKNSEEVAATLDRRNIAVRAGFHCAKSAHEKLKTTDVGAVRVSPSIFNGINEIDYLYEIIKKI